MSDDRDRVTAILNLGESETPGAWESACNALPELCHRLLEALDTIDKAKALHKPWPLEVRGRNYCQHCDKRWPCPDWLAFSGEGSQQ